eukprot:787882-Amphidinium_carterae.1
MHPRFYIVAFVFVSPCISWASTGWTLELSSKDQRGALCACFLDLFGLLEQEVPQHNYHENS